MLRLHGLVGHRDQPDLAARLHALEHHGAIETLYIPVADIARRRLRLSTDRGTDCAISLDAHETLGDGAVLFLDATRAIVARVGAEQTLRLRPANAEAALRLGWHAGNLHWRVRFEQDVLVVLLDSPVSDYRARLAPLLADGQVAVLPGGD